MATIVTRAGKGSPLTHNEVDANFTNLNSDKIENGDTVASLTLTAVDVADKITHTGDTDTSIRFPAADTVTVETAGSERVRVDSSGNVGIGTSSPAEELDVNGTIKATNVSDGTLSIPTTYVTNGSAKAWVNFNGTGTIAARDSLNVSSLTDNGTGDYTVNFTNNFGAADYAYVGIAGDTTSASASLVQCPFDTAPTSSAAQVHVDNSSFNAVDRLFVQSTFHGDLAA